ncbi:MucBP domain-containing protein [Secundilactobacillus yichangensis]|uniref:MucBP domain-containing protein n=1 Tax=Secundilactobacillus yichangensis TaxID=2799580 RepID=UPI001942854F|nr:MucBP domain-containing protein [Secundilactobacillus yichangensis]
MAFFDRLLKLMTINRPRTPSHHRKTVVPENSTLTAGHTPAKPVQPITDQSADDPKPQNSPVEQPTEKPVETQPESAVMLVLYLDEQNHSLTKPQWLIGRLGEKIHFTPRHIDNYLLFHIIGFTTLFASPYRIMTLQYTKKLGHPVIMYAIDYDTREMVASPVIQTGAVNQPFAFSRTVVDGFHLIKASRPLTGHFTEKAQTIVVMLRRDSWTAVQRINIFVQLLDSTQILDQPDGQAYSYEFPKNSVWRAFVRVNTQNGETWFNLGGPQWINGKDVTQTDKPAHQQIGQQRAVAFKPIKQSAVIDFVSNHSLHTYDQPNGQAVKLIADGTQVQLTGECTDDNQLKWYRMADGNVILAQYVKLN